MNKQAALRTPRSPLQKQQLSHLLHPTLAPPRRPFPSAPILCFAFSMSTTTPSAAGRRAVIWFRNDLRLRDNEAVSAVVSKVKRGEVADVVPVYVFDPRFFKASAWGNVKTGAHRWVWLARRMLGVCDASVGAMEVRWNRMG
jgi:hypothetical protein